MKLKRIGLFIWVFLFAAISTAQTDLNLDLMLAAAYGEDENVRTLLDRGADVNTIGKHAGLTPLISATRGGHTTTVILLLNRGADVNVKSKLFGYTAIIGAAAFGDIEMVKALLNRDAEVNVRNDDGVTALTFAEEAGKSNIIKLLKQHGAKK